MKLQWKVLRSDVPSHLKPLALVLALIAKDKDGSGIWVRTEVLADYLGLHRVTVSHQMQALSKLGIVSVLRRGGRWRDRRGNVIGRATERCLSIAKLEALGGSASATWSTDLVAPELHGRSDLVAPGLRIKTGTYVKPGTKNGKLTLSCAAPTQRPREYADVDF